MALILLKEYAERHGVAKTTVQDRITRGTTKAVKIGRMWFIDEDEPFEDHRVTSGKYVGQKRKRT